MLWKCCTQYVSKFGKLSSGHSNGKGQFSFQSQRKAMPKNAQTTVQLFSFPMLVSLCLKCFKVSFNSTWTKNIQMFKLVLEKAEEPEIQLPASAGSSKTQESSRKISTSGLLTTPKPLTVWMQTNCGKFLKRWECQTTWPASWETYVQSRSNNLNQTWNNGLVPNWERSTSRLYISPCLFNLYAEYIMRNAGLDEA